ncbi:DUF6000 family protein [Streptomyces sp. NPDC058307]|uniref:DUF6000 family protein n=1 Tax=Streptomyces sp. NPDC058307 TaxID=3346439 RepID=UPI0036ED0284
MRCADEEKEPLKLIRRYVTPDRRYLKLGGNLLGMSGRDRTKFLRKLGQAAGEISPRELDTLFDRGWRERKTAAWLVAVAGKSEFRDRLGELQPARPVPHTLHAPQPGAEPRRCASGMRFVHLIRYVQKGRWSGFGLELLWGE